MMEIGSEFWLNRKTEKLTDFELPNWLNIGYDNKLLLSGRTAIHYILKDIQKNKKINTVYFPSYCCQSMIQPFIDLGVNIIFYHVYFEDGLKFDIDVNQKCDIFFAMNYFGFSKGRMDRYIEVFKQRNVTVIEDSTHSLLSDSIHNNQSDYVVVSLRKWFPVLSGGIAIKTNGKFKINNFNGTLEKMIEVRKSAMLLKGKYMNGDEFIEKKEFLQAYMKANEMLNNDYAFYNIDTESLIILQNLDLNDIIYKRKENARELYDNLLLGKNSSFLFSEFEEGDCPMFIPIIVDSSKNRDRLRDHLINKNIYCPIHWPKPKMLNRENPSSSIYNNEISLVIDHRYNKYDMQYVIRSLVEFYE